MINFQALLNGGFNRINPATVDLVSQLSLCHRRDEDPTAEKLVQALKQMANGNATGPDDLPAELLKLAISGDRKVLSCASSHYLGRTEGAEGTADLEGCRDSNPAQEEGPERLR